MKERSVRIVLIAIIVIVVIAFSVVLLSQQREIDALSGRASQLDRERADALAKVGLLQQDLDKAKSDASNLQQQLTQSQSEVSRLQRELDKVMSDVSSLQQEIAKSKTNLSDLQQKLAEKTSEMSRIQQDLAKEKSKVSDLQAELASLQSQISALESEKASLLKRISVLTSPLEQRHLNASFLTPEDCLTCHSSVLNEPLADGFATPHRIHLNNILLRLTCTDCHKSVDITEKSGASLRRQVDVELCAECHSEFPTENTPMQPAYKDIDCTTAGCHDNWKDRMADALYVNLDKITSKDCFTCHGENAWYQERGG